MGVLVAAEKVSVMPSMAGFLRGSNRHTAFSGPAAVSGRAPLCGCSGVSVVGGPRGIQDQGDPKIVTRDVGALVEER